MSRNEVSAGNTSGAGVATRNMGEDRMDGGNGLDAGDLGKAGVTAGDTDGAGVSFGD